MTEITSKICIILDFSVLITCLLFRHYESQEPGTYTLYKNKDPLENINEVKFWLQKNFHLKSDNG